MKRYTLKLQTSGPTFSLNDLRNEVEQVLLQLHPRITYKMGQVFQGVDGKVLAEIAVDGKRQLLDEAFMGKSWRLPVRFESLSWGWSLENEDTSILISSTSAINSDPLAGITPLEGKGEYLLRKRLSHGRYIALMISTLVLILVLIANALHPHSLGLQVLYIVFFAIFMFTLNDTPLDIRVYAEKITITERMLEVSFWLLKKPACIEWEKIWGLDYTNPVCIVHSKGSKTRFLLSERFGCKDKTIVMKTIVKRAGLSYVEGNFQKLIYLKPDA